MVDISASIVDRDALDELLAMPGIIAEEPVGQHVSVRTRLKMRCSCHRCDPLLRHSCDAKI